MIMTTGENFFVAHHRIKDGSIIDVEASAQYLPTDGGRFVTFMRDITERKKAEEELYRAKVAADTAKEQLKLASKAGGVSIWEYDVINNRLYWDDQMYCLYGVQPDTFENIYQAWTAVLHPDDVLRVNEDVRLALSGEEKYELDFRVVWPGGSIHAISASGQVQRDAAGQTVSMIGANWDITRAKLAEE